MKYGMLSWKCQISIVSEFLYLWACELSCLLISTIFVHASIAGRVYLCCCYCHADTSNSSTPGEVSVRSAGRMSELICAVRCGPDSSMFLTDTGRVYACGKYVDTTFHPLPYYVNVNHYMFIGSPGPDIVKI